MNMTFDPTQFTGAMRRNVSFYTTSEGNRGFTLIELMIVIAVVAILLSLALPVYSTYAVRAKIGEGLAVAKAAKIATGAACQEDRSLTTLTNNKVGYPFLEVAGDEAYVENIEVSGECSEPVITITTKNTGAEGEDPIITLTGEFTPGSGQVQWTCASDNTPDHLLPDTCRN